MSLTTQFYAMIAMIAVGSYLGASLDIYSRLFNRLRSKFWVVFINDILFWNVQGLLIFYCLYTVNFGEIRFYIFVALLCGFAFYQSLLKTLYNRLLELIIRFIIRTYNIGAMFTSIFIIRPVIVLFTFIVTVAIGIGKFLLNVLTFFGRVLLSTLKILIRPIIYFAKLGWKLVPNSIKIKVNDYFRKIVIFYQKVISFIKKKKEK